MIKTYNDLILACEGFEYSKEYFELYKEASEIDLMEIYSSNQEFMVENAELITESADVLDGYFQEAVSKEANDDVKKKTAEKKGNLFKRIWEKILKVLRAFRNFFVRLGQNIKSRYNMLVNASKLSIGREYAMNNPELKKLYRDFDAKMNKLSNYIFVFGQNRDADGVIENEYIKHPLMQYIRMFASGKVKVQRPDDSKACTPSEISKMTKALSKGDVKKARDVYSKVKETNMISVPWVEGSLQKAVQDLKDAEDYITSLNEQYQKIIYDDQSSTGDIANARNVVESVNDVIIVVADSMKLYTGIDNISKLANEYAQKIINAVGDSKKSDSEAKKTARETEAAYKEREKQEQKENKEAGKAYNKELKKQKRAKNAA